MSACNYGAPTIRKRFFMVARNDGAPIEWPEPTHGPQHSGLKPYRTAADIIDWSVPVKSIFGRKRPLAEKTLQRIAKGLKKFVFESDSPFLIPTENQTPFITECANASSQRNMPVDEPLRTICAQVKGGHFAVVTAHIDRQFGNSEGASIGVPLGSITAGGAGKSALVSTFIAKHYTGVVGSSAKEPLHTVTTADHNALVTSHMVKLRGTNIGHRTNEPVHTISAGGFHLGEVRAFLLKYYGTSYGEAINSPIGTVTTKDRFGLVTIQGNEYQIVDIGMRMLEPHELFAAQGFPSDYQISHRSDGKKRTKTEQVARCGNSVCPPVARALVEANLATAIPQEVAA